jgi:SAM-dependent methyltransferase
MDITKLQANWNRFGETDPLWAILVDPAKKGGKWEKSEFFETGRNEINAVMNYLISLPIELNMDSAIDFGCGVGRLTQALCEHFSECHGVDIAESMIELANNYNCFGRKAQYHLNQRPDLSLFSDNTFDLVYSNLVLQHMEPRYSTEYIREFMRIVKPGGIVLFQLPSEPSTAEYNPALFAIPPLPPSGFKALIRPVNVPKRMKAGSKAVIQVSVQNISDVPWPMTPSTSESLVIQLGNHWLDCDEKIIENEDGRTPLPHEIKPQQEIEMSFTVSAPEKEGVYFLEFDMVQEHIDWFKTRGSSTARAHIKIVNGGSHHADDENEPDSPRQGFWNRIFHRTQKPTVPQQEPEPRMEMYSIPKQTVIDLIEKSGGSMVDVQLYDVAGEGWISYRYCAKKA